MEDRERNIKKQVVIEEAENVEVRGFGHPGLLAHLRGGCQFPPEVLPVRDVARHRPRRHPEEGTSSGRAEFSPGQERTWRMLGWGGAGQGVGWVA